MERGCPNQSRKGAQLYRVARARSVSQCTHTLSHTLAITCTCTCCYDVICGAQDGKMMCSHAHSLILSPAQLSLCLLSRQQSGIFLFFYLTKARFESVKITSTLKLSATLPRSTTLASCLIERIERCLEGPNGLMNADDELNI